MTAPLKLPAEIVAAMAEHTYEAVVYQIELANGTSPDRTKVEDAYAALVSAVLKYGDEREDKGHARGWDERGMHKR